MSSFNVCCLHNCVQSLLAPAAADDWYFSYWDCPDSHLAVLQDTTYQEAWSRAVTAAQHLIQDKVVLDVGCGLGTLSMLAAKVCQSHTTAAAGDAALPALFRRGGLQPSQSFQGSRTLFHMKCITAHC